MNYKIAVTMSVAVAVAGCAPKAENIAGTYTPVALYENLSCQQLVTEARIVSNRAHDAVRLQNRHRVEDEVAITAGVIIFWPALFFTHGTDATAGQVAQLRGEMQAIEAASAANNCGIVFNRA
ncbi:hypothetical protein ABFT80_26860 [Mesorhizobium sp. SB112]|uniref:hypothetical protein n=1 Tax=Mesorhizobium sp. SB112 TaxID=3151853 RepID=UPI0032637C91